MHYQRPAGGYDDYGLYVWGDVDPSMSTTWPAGQPFAGEDSYGRFAYVKLAPAAKTMGFIVVSKDGVKDVDADRSLDPSKNPEVWLKQGDPTVYPSRKAATGQDDPAQDPNTAIIHYHRADGDYSGWGLHVWDGAATGTDWGSPLPPAATDAFGVTFRVPLAAGATGLSYIIHKGDTKDLPDDQRLDFATAGREVWLLAGTADPAAAGGPEGRRRRRDRPGQVEGGLDGPRHDRLEARRTAPTARNTRWSTPPGAASRSPTAN